MRLSKFAAAATFALAAIAVTTEAASVGKAKALRVMHERDQGMRAIGKATKVLRRELDASTPDLATIRPSAAKIAGLSRKVPRWFPKGSGPEVGKTRAKAEIWRTPRDFAAKAHEFDLAARSLNAAAAAGDVAAVKGAFTNLGKSCKACHDPYRAEEKE